MAIEIAVVKQLVLARTCTLKDYRTVLVLKSAVHQSVMNDCPIMDVMYDQSLYSLLPRGTTTWQNHRNEITIDLVVLVSDELASAVSQCDIYVT